MDKEIKSAFVGVTILSILAILAIVFINPLLGETLHVDKGIYHVVYDTTLEQPLRVSYKVTNRPKNADRKGMNFKKEPNIHTSDDKDYVNNVWDKGHMAPAAHFSDSEEILLNCLDNPVSSFILRLTVILSNQSSVSWRVCDLA